MKTSNKRTLVLGLAIAAIIVAAPAAFAGEPPADDAINYEFKFAVDSSDYEDGTLTAESRARLRSKTNEYCAQAASGAGSDARRACRQEIYFSVKQEAEAQRESSSVFAQR